MKSLGVYYWCQNDTLRVCGAQIRIYNVLCSKIDSTLGGLFWKPDGSRQAARGACICQISLLNFQNKIYQKPFKKRNHERKTWQHSSIFSVFIVSQYSAAICRFYGIQVTAVWKPLSLHWVFWLPTNDVSNCVIYIEYHLGLCFSDRTPFL